jgi:elongation factor Ts
VEITASMVKELREKTGAGVMECRNALIECKGEIQRAIEILRMRGSAKAAKKSSRKTLEGLIGSYVHFGGRIGVLVEVNCETDFVAATELFRGLVKDLTLQIASTNPIYLSKDDVPQEVIEKEKEAIRQQALLEGRPEEILDRIIEGKMKKFYSETCLMEQPFIKDDTITIRDLIERAISKLGENIVVRRFTRYQLGEDFS